MERFRGLPEVGLIQWVLASASVGHHRHTRRGTRKQPSQEYFEIALKIVAA
jgi:hypothetical protein